MWRYRLYEALKPIVSLDLSTDTGMRGRYLWVGSGDPPFNRLFGEPCALGRFVGEGDEAKVYQLIRLRTGSWNEVVKICKFPPGHQKYKTWLTEVRDESNSFSRLPEVERHPAWIVEVPGGAVKVQSYLLSGVSHDWESALQIVPVLQAMNIGDLAKAEQLTDVLIEQQGDRPLLLEQKAILTGVRKDFECARELWAKVIKGYRSDESFNVLVAYTNYAHLLLMLYEKYFDELPGLMKIALPDDNIMSMQIADIGTPDQIAMDQDYSDQAVEVLLEALAVEPCFLPALLKLYHLIPGHEPDAKLAVLRRMIEIDSQIEPVVQDEILKAEARIAIMTQARIKAQASVDSPILRDELAKIEAAYEPPIPDGADQATSRAFAARHYLSKGTPERALAAAEEALELKPNVPEYHALACDCLSALGRREESRARLLMITKRFTDSWEVYETLGRTCYELKLYRESCIAFLKANSCHDGSAPDILLQISSAYRKMNQIDKARGYLQRAIELGADVAEVLYVEQLIIRDTFHTSNQSVVALTRVAEIVDSLKGNNLLEGRHLFTAAQVSCLAGEFSIAITQLEMGLTLDPANIHMEEFLTHVRAHVESQ